MDHINESLKNLAKGLDLLVDRVKSIENYLNQLECQSTDDEDDTGSESDTASPPPIKRASIK